MTRFGSVESKTHEDIDDAVYPGLCIGYTIVMYIAETRNATNSTGTGRNPGLPAVAAALMLMAVAAGLDSDAVEEGIAVIVRTEDSAGAVTDMRSTERNVEASSVVVVKVTSTQQSLETPACAVTHSL
jgi:hypothetical protein